MCKIEVLVVTITAFGRRSLEHKVRFAAFANGALRWQLMKNPIPNPSLNRTPAGRLTPARQSPVSLLR